MRFGKLLSTVADNIKRLFSRGKKKGPKRPRKARLPQPPIEALPLQQSAPALPPPRAFPVVRPQAALDEFSGVQLSRHTQKAYRRDLNDFFAYLNARGQLTTWNVDLTPIDIANYRSHLVEDKKLAKPSVTRKLAVLKSFFRWAMAREWMSYNPAELVRGYPQTQESKTGFLVDAEIDRLLIYLDHLPRERLFFELARVALQTLLMLGLRRGEASRIRLGDLAYQEDKWLLRIKGKGDRERLLPLPERLLDTWEPWLRRIGEEAPRGASLKGDPGPWLSYFYRNGERPLLVSSRAKSFTTPLSDAEIGHITRRFGRKAGLTQRLSPHMLRATAITHALDQGASDRAVQQMAGWTSPLMITRYDKRRRDPRFSAVYHLKFAKRLATTAEKSALSPPAV